jgi:hypothetical protein
LQPREPEPSTINEKTVAHAGLVEQTGFEPGGRGMKEAAN